MNNFFKTFFCIFFVLSLLVSCQSGKTIRVDTSQVTEYRDLTIRDLDEMSSKMFPKLMQSALAKSDSATPPTLAIGPMISANSSNSSLNDYIQFARSQQGRSNTNLPDYILIQKIFENREYQPRVIFKTYTYILELVDLRPQSTSLGAVVVSETETIVKQVRK